MHDLYYIYGDNDAAVIMRVENNGTLRNRIVVLRAEKRWSQQELAERVGVSRQTIASLEANRYNPSLKLAFEIAHVFDRKIDEVFDYIREEQ